PPTAIYTLSLHDALPISRCVGLLSMPDDILAVEPAPVALVRTSQPFIKADPHGSYLRVKTFAALNGVRCLCCLAVIKEHVGWEVDRKSTRLNSSHLVISY